MPGKRDEGWGEEAVAEDSRERPAPAAATITCLRGMRICAFERPGRCMMPENGRMGNPRGT